MENKNFDSPVHRLLPMEEGNPWQIRTTHKRKNILTLENTLKALSFLIVLSACLTSVACAIYSYQNLKKVQTIHQEILDLENPTTTIKPEQSPPEAAPVVAHNIDVNDVDDNFVDEAEDYSDDDDDDDEWYDEDDDEYDDDDDDDYLNDYEDEEDFYEEEDNFLPTLDNTDDEFRDDDETIIESSGYESDDEDYSRIRRSTDAKKGNKGRKGKKGGKERKGKQQQSKKGVKTRKQKKLKSLPTAQFYANITVDDLDKIGIGHNPYEKTPDCKYNSEMGGVYCLNRTFTPDSDKPLKLFKPEPWVDGQKSPVNVQGRKFAVKNSGTHLIYAQLLMEATQSRVNASIIRERKGSEEQHLTCTNDCINSNPNSAVNFRCTCSIFGLMNLRENDVLFVQVPESENKIILDESSTYVGIVQLNRD